ncbi:MAG: site-specific tyrosine recombinase/integron integrase [Promethearchaeota archaeon]
MLETYIDDFLLSKEIENGCALSTIKAYKYDLSLFEKSINKRNKEFKISNLNQIHIRHFLRSLKEKSYTKTAIARKIACLRSFFNFLEQSEYITKNPMRKINSPRIKREEQLPKFLTIKEMVNLLDFLKNGNEIPYLIRKRAYIIIRLLYSSMARVSEITKAKIRDVNFTKGIMRLRGKGNKERIIPIDQGTLKVLKESLSNRIVYNGQDPLLINKSGKRLSVRTIQKDIQIIKEKLGLSKDRKLTPHIFRHTGATHLRQAGMDISELQDILGHSSPNTTRIYAKNDIGKIKEEYIKKHPLTQL